MKTQMTISIEKDLKEAFKQLALDLGTNPTNLLNMLIKNSINSDEITLRRSQRNDLIEIEPFSKEEIESLAKNENIKENTRKLEKLLANV